MYDKGIMAPPDHPIYSEPPSIHFSNRMRKPLEKKDTNSTLENMPTPSDLESKSTPLEEAVGNLVDSIFEEGRRRQPKDRALLKMLSEDTSKEPPTESNNSTE
jgi:hypothetical protein